MQPPRHLWSQPYHADGIKVSFFLLLGLITTNSATLVPPPFPTSWLTSGGVASGAPDAPDSLQQARIIQLVPFDRFPAVDKSLVQMRHMTRPQDYMTSSWWEGGPESYRTDKVWAQQEIKWSGSMLKREDGKDEGFAAMTSQWHRWSRWVDVGCVHHPAQHCFWDRAVTYSNQSTGLKYWPRNDVRSEMFKFGGKKEEKSKLILVL